MFKFVTIAVVATAVAAQEIDEAIKELITMENCEYKTAEQIKAEAEDEEGVAAAACSAACAPEGWAEMDEDA